jgi:hypothetical protein
VTDGQEDGFDGDFGVDGCRALEGDEGDCMVLGYGPDQGIHCVAVARMPEPGKGAALELAGVGGADMGAGETEIELVVLVEFEDEGVGKSPADAGGIDIAAIGRAAGAAERVPVVVERLCARLLHRLSHIPKRRHCPELRNARRHWPTLAKPAAEIALKQWLRLISAAQCG